MPRKSKGEIGMNRRQFLKVTAGASAMIAGIGLAVPARGRAIPPPVCGKRTPVCLAGVGPKSSGAALRSAVREAAEAATDFAWLSRGDTVLIKIAQNSGLPYPMTTHPDAVAAVTALLKQKGARRVLVADMSGIEYVKLSPEGVVGSTRRMMQVSGTAKAAKEAGAELHAFEEAGWKGFYEDMPAAGSHWKRGLMLPNILKEVDHIVLMPRCGRHALAGSTLGLKAAVGYWRFDTRLELHRYGATFQEKVAEGNTVTTLLAKQRLVVTAADKLLVSFGPDQGHVYAPRNGLVIASESVAAHDMAALAWLLENRREARLSWMEAFVDTTTLVPRIATSVVVTKLGGLGQAFAAEMVVKNDLRTIWDDRVLARAFQLFGGAPLVEFKDANNRVTEHTKRTLQEGVALAPRK